MKAPTPSQSDLLREAELALNNQNRLMAWRHRWFLAKGYWPALPVNPVLTPREAALVRPRQGRPAGPAHNGHIVKMPHHRRQIMHVRLRTEPDDLIA